MKINGYQTMLFFLIIFVLYSCRDVNNSKKKYNNVLVDTSLFLMGKWGGAGENSPVWDIQKDSIYYYQRQKAYPYKYVNGDLIIDLGESKGVLHKVRVVLDTLFFYDEQGNPIRGYRFR